MTCPTFMVFLMQVCSICDREIYGHKQQAGKLVCGSCTLSKSPGTKAGKSSFEVRLDLASIVIQQHPNRESMMREIKVKSKIRNKVLLLDNRHPLIFDENGVGKLPAHLRELLEREMTARPGRYSIVEETPAVVVTPEKKAEVVPPKPVEIKKEVSPALKEEVPAEVDLSFLSDEPEVKSKKASKKK